MDAASPASALAFWTPLRWKHVHEIPVHFVICWDEPSGLAVAPHGCIETKDAHIDVLQPGDLGHLLYDASRGATARSCPLVDLVDDRPPPVGPIEFGRGLKLIAGLAREGRAVEPPQSAGVGLPSNVLEGQRRAVQPLCEAEDGRDVRALRDEVESDMSLPRVPDSSRRCTGGGHSVPLCRRTCAASPSLRSRERSR